MIPTNHLKGRLAILKAVDPDYYEGADFALEDTIAMLEEILAAREMRDSMDWVAFVATVASVKAYDKIRNASGE